MKLTLTTRKGTEVVIWHGVDMISSVLKPGSGMEKLSDAVRVEQGEAETPALDLVAAVLRRTPHGGEGASNHIPIDKVDIDELRAAIRETGRSA